jgi:hypothetical protein
MAHTHTHTHTHTCAIPLIQLTPKTAACTGYCQTSGQQWTNHVALCSSQWRRGVDNNDWLQVAIACQCYRQTRTLCVALCGTQQYNTMRLGVYARMQQYRWGGSEWPICVALRCDASQHCHGIDVDHVQGGRQQSRCARHSTTSSGDWHSLVCSATM